MDTLHVPAGADSPYAYAGPDALRQPIETALRRVVDPEVAMSIVDVGLVYGVSVGDDRVNVVMTMTSAALTSFVSTGVIAVIVSLLTTTTPTAASSITTVAPVRKPRPVIVTLVPEIDPVLGAIRSTTGESGPLVFVVGVGAIGELLPHATAVASIAAKAQIADRAVIEDPSCL